MEPYPELRAIKEDKMISQQHLKAIVDRFDQSIPRTSYHLKWRLALIIRFMRPVVDLSEPAAFTWVSLAGLFGERCPKTFRYWVVERFKKV